MKVEYFSGTCFPAFLKYMFVFVSEDAQEDFDKDFYELNISANQSLLDEDDMKCYVKPPNSIFDSIASFSKWKKHCKEQYWYYYDWFMQWYCGGDLIGSYIPSHTSPQCVDGEEQTAPSKCGGIPNSGATNNGKSAPISTANPFVVPNEEKDEDDPHEKVTVKIKSIHEFDGDEDTNTAVNSKSKTCKTSTEACSTSTDACTKEINLNEIDFPETCSFLGYKFNNQPGTPLHFIVRYYRFAICLKKHKT